MRSLCGCLRRRARSQLTVAADATAMPPGAEANTRGFYLHKGDTVVFYGDSITEQNYYNQ